MKIANWNIEWMNHWFTADGDGPPRFRDSIAGVVDVPALAERVAGVIRALAADLVTIQEGPSRKAEMQLFVDACLDSDYDVLGPAGKGAQKLYALVRKQGEIDQAGRVRPSPGQIDFDDAWQVDIQGDLALEDYAFTRAPLEVELSSAGRRLRLLNVHTKSKFVHRGPELWADPATRHDYIEQAVINRRRISAEMMRVRTYLDQRLTADPEELLIVVGDFNDGPGADFFEQRYLSHNSVGVVSGTPFEPRLLLRHAFIDRELRAEAYTAVFDDFVDGIPNRKLLLDHILLSPALYWAALRKAGIEHRAFEAFIDRGTPRDERGHLPSDHRPQTVILEF